MIIKQTEIKTPKNVLNQAFHNANANLLNCWVENECRVGYSPPWGGGEVWVRDQSDWLFVHGMYVDPGMFGLSSDEKMERDWRAVQQFLDFKDPTYPEGMIPQNITKNGRSHYTLRTNSEMCDKEWGIVATAYHYYHYYGDDRIFIHHINWEKFRKVLTFVENNDTNHNGLIEKQESFDWGDCCGTSRVDSVYESIGFARACRYMAEVARETMNDMLLSKLYSTKAARTIEAIEGMWDPEESRYEFNRYADGRLYDHGSKHGLVSDMWTVLYGEIDQDRINTLFAKWLAIRSSYPGCMGFPIIEPAMVNTYWARRSDGVVSADTSESEENAMLITTLGKHQNHGDWFWWDGDALRAMYAHGWEDEATMVLEAMAYPLAAENYCEWFRLNGTDDGGAYSQSPYGATTSSFALAVIEGLFGITPLRPGFDSISIHPHLPLEWKSASINVVLPKDNWLNYSLSQESDEDDPDSSLILLTVTASRDMDASFELKVRNGDAASAWCVTVNGDCKAAYTVKRRLSTYIIFEHRLQAEMRTEIRINILPE